MHAQRSSALTENERRLPPLQRLRIPAILAIVFFCASLLLSKTGFSGRVIEYDPSLPLWFLVTGCRSMFIWIIARRIFVYARHGLKFLRYFLLALIVSGTSAAEITLILPASYLVGPAKTDSYGVVMQTLHVTCIPSSLATICRLYGEQIGELEATQKVKTLLFGSLISHAVIGAHQLGFSEAAYSDLTMSEMLKENLPFIITLGTGIAQVEHAVGVIGYRNGQIYLADPLRGMVVTTPERLEKDWQYRILRLGPRRGQQTAPGLDAFSPELLRPGT